MKYRIGDEVRITTGTFATFGMCGKIIKLEGTSFYHVDERKHGTVGFPYREYELELVRPAHSKELI